MVALLMGYRGYASRDDGEATLSAYYVASNALYHVSRQLAERCRAEGARCQVVELPAKGMLAQCGVAHIGRHSISATRGLGSRFAVQWLVTDAFSPDADPLDNAAPLCGSCKRCVQACPTGAISEGGLRVERCLRAYLGGDRIPGWVKETMPGYLGCEICQRVCPHNAAIRPVSMPDEYKEAFCFSAILAPEEEAMRRFRPVWRAAVGKNMLSRGRLRSQALVLAAREGRGEFERQALHWRVAGEDAVQDAAEYYLRNLAGKP